MTDTPTPQKIPKEILEITNKMDLMTDTPTSQRIPINLTDNNSVHYGWIEVLLFQKV